MKKWLSKFFLFSVFFLFSLSGYPLPANSQIEPSALTQPPIRLQIVEQTINVNGKPAEIFRIKQPDGTWGLTAKKGQDLNIIVENKTKSPSSIHWHGIILPNNQDGVPYVTQLPIMPGEKRHYHFKLVQAGTFWMHSHFRLQEQKLLAAPFIIEDPAEPKANQEVVMLLEDFTFKDPKLVYKGLRCASYANPNKTEQMDGMHHMDMSGKNAMNMDNMKMPMQMSGMDLNDVKYDAFLANEHTLANPVVIQVRPEASVRLRIINASASTNFYVNTGQLTGKLIAVDGANIQPIAFNPVQLGIGQRADIIVKIPRGEGSYPILAQAEGTNMQTGIILATKDAPRIKISDIAAQTAPALNYSQEQLLRAKEPLANKAIDRSINLGLQGNMQKYIWKINNQIWPNVTPPQVKEGERVEFVFKNETSMAHPMHFHGHVFQITEIDGKKISGANRDTILVLPNSTVKVQFDATNPGVWMLHCHNLYHSASGMITKLIYDNFPLPKYTLEQEASMSGSLFYTNAKQCMEGMAMPAKAGK